MQDDSGDGHAGKPASGRVFRGGRVRGTDRPGEVRNQLERAGIRGSFGMEHSHDPIACRDRKQRRIVLLRKLPRVR